MEIIGASESLHPDLNTLFGEWASLRVFGEPGQFERFCSFGVRKGGALIAVVLLHGYDPRAGVIEISAAGAGAWQSRRLIRQVFDTCFDTLGCQMILMRNAESNTTVVRNSRRLGFDGVLVPRLAGRGEGQWIFTLTDDQWRAHRLNQRREGHEQESSQAA